HIIREMEEIIHETFPKFISLKTEIDRGLLPISGDATQLHQVMMNLCVNARDAMPSGGALTVKAGNQVLDESFTRIHLGAKPGLYSVITIADTGIGMPDEVISKIFEPFFTTKEKGKGTGLGLATVHSIVKNHNGFVTVESAINKGTTFSVFLPAVELSQLSPTDLRYEDLPSGHGECILIVDDEASVRDITKQTLEMFGYTVMEAADGTDAISLYAKNQSNIDAVLTDIMMPIMDGYATIRALNRINPNLIVIAASGLATDHQIIETTAGKIDGFLQKPFTPTALLEILHKLLSKRSIPPIHPQPKN
ncbi:MAG: response regulator, partial [Bacteroidetes bacterium]